MFKIMLIKISYHIQSTDRSEEVVPEGPAEERKAVGASSSFFLPNSFKKTEVSLDGPQRINRDASSGVTSYLDSHVAVGEDHVEVIVDHAELFPQLCDQILVLQVLLAKTLHRLVFFWRTKETQLVFY